MNKIRIADYSTTIMDLVDKGLKPTLIARLLNLVPASVSSWIRTNHPEISFLPNPGNVHYFDNIDSYAKAYILGFIAADGALVKSKSCTSLTITVKYEDKAVLEFIKLEIGSAAPLLEITRPASYNPNKIIHHIRYTNARKELVLGIMKYNITYNKSLTMSNIINNISYKYRDAFIVGYFDGDGSVSTINDLRKIVRVDSVETTLYIFK